MAQLMGKATGNKWTIYRWKYSYDYFLIMFHKLSVTQYY